MTSVTHVIVSYRQFELTSWKQCLDTEVWRMREGAIGRWWFYIYQLIGAYLQPPEEGEEHDSEESTQNKTLEDILSSLHQFMEMSVVGEFSTRLDLLSAFWRQLVHMEYSEKQDSLLRIFWNLHQYYSQYTDHVTSYISHQRAPIEKQLKNYVKIARWNDINFYALKQAVEKTHKTLHKHIKEFRDVLGRPVRQLLTDSHSDWMTSHSNNTDKTNGLTLQLYMVPKDTVETKVTQTSGLLDGRLLDYTQKLRTHCIRLIKQSQYGKLADSLDTFTGDIIESVHDLQKLNADDIKDKDKQKTAIKHIQLRKRKALADLFRYLKNIGLSYRKGLQMLKEAETIADMTSSPLDVTTAVQSLEPLGCDADITSVWTDCPSYYTRCIARKALLHSAINTPSKELGVGNIERIKGFSQHLANVVQSQWTRLAEVNDQVISIRKQISNLNKLSVCTSLPPQSQATHWRDDASTLCVRVIEFCHQMSTILECLPASPPGVVTVDSPWTPIHLAPLADMTRSDVEYSEIEELLKSSKDLCENLMDKLPKSSTDVWTMGDLDTITDVFSSLSPLLPKLQNLQKLFSAPNNPDNNFLAESISFIYQQINDKSTCFNQWKTRTFGVFECKSGDATDSESGQRSNDDFENRLESVLKDVLLAVQGLVKIRKLEKEKENSDDKENGENKDEDFEVDLEEGLVTRKLQQGLDHEVELLRMDKISNDLGSLLDTCLQTGSNFTQISQCLPLLEQYTYLSQYIYTQCVLRLRTTAKLHSVLLAVFADLAQKGFCAPAEYSDEAEGEGATDFQDIEGGGLGEGEGAKDVSEQIETEDQLEDTMKQGEEKGEEDQSEKPDLKSEDNAIEMSQDIDGKMQDLSDAEDDNESEEENQDGDENDIDKEMGDLGENDADKLDDQVWGSDDEEDPEKQEDKQDESGPGSGQQSAPELVAKDDNDDTGEGDKKEPETKESEMKEEEEEKTNEQENVDEREYDENETDAGNQGDKQNEVEAMDLPEDLNLEGEDQEPGQEEGEDKQEENPMDVDTVLDEQPDEKQDENEEENEGDIEENEQEKEEKETKEEEKEDENGGDDAQDAENMDTEDGVNDEHKQGLEPEDESKPDDQTPEDDENKPADDVAQAAEMSAKTSHDTQDVQQVDQSQDAAGKSENDQQEKEGTGMAESEQDQGHEGKESSMVSRGAQKQQPNRAAKRKPGESRDDRTLGTAEDKIKKRLKTVDSKQQDDNDPGGEKESDLYEHIKDPNSQHDAQTMDTATVEQQRETGEVKDETQDSDNEECNDNINMDDTEDNQDTTEVENMSSAKLKKPQDKKDGEGETVEDEEAEKENIEISGDKIETLGVQNRLDSTFHTAFQNLSFNRGDLDIEELRRELEEELHTWSHSNTEWSQHEEDNAKEAWQKYETVTSSLSQELCEQLRLVLEPSQASKLRGDYRTGKRLNMRKVIPYIASQFRKDKIWLRRTKPSKRNYQVMVAIDDSSSMADNHSKQLAFESLATVANALTLLEVGELGICSFGETVKVLHSFTDQFSNQSGAKILHQFTFEQKKTKIAQLLNHMTGVMIDGRPRQQGHVTNPDTSQLLLIVSDGRGLFLEGMEVVQGAVRKAREANVFTVFVIIDNPDNKDSILDIRVPVFGAAGALPEIKSYMDHFPFPFYLILRDINSLPSILSDALRQWFELVTATDL